MKKTVTKAKKTTKGINRPMVKTVDQLTLARIIAQKHEIPIAEVLEIVVEEQKLTMQFVNDGYRVIKKNYLTMEAKQYESKTWVSPLDKKTYETGEHRRVLVRIGEVFLMTIKRWKTGFAASLLRKKMKIIQKILLKPLDNS